MLTGFVLFASVGSGNFYISAWRQVTANRKNGMALNFAINMDTLFVEAPTDYSKENASTILSSVSKEERDRIGKQCTAEHHRRDGRDLCGFVYSR